MLRTPWRLVPRTQPSARMRFLAPLMAVAMTAVFGCIVFYSLGLSPLKAMQVFMIEPLSTVNGVSELLLKASPICLIALGLAVGYRANVWNIGAEGQMYLGGIFATGLAIHFHDGGGHWLLPLMVVAGACGGALWAAIPAVLRTKCHANEILVSLMLTYVADLLVKYLVYGPWQDPASNNFPLTVAFSDNAIFPLFASFGGDWLEGTRVNVSLFITLAALPLAWFFMQRTFAGYQLTVAGVAPSAARYAGFSSPAAVWMSMLIGGAAAGIAGVMEVAGPIGQLNDRWTPGYGFTAIIVATLGRLHPFGIALASLLMALVYLGGEAVQISLQLPKAISLVFQGLLLMLILGCDVLVNYRIERRPAADAA
ncbi:MAG TPA: ABC transporter permease [Burkholderiales bacterium]|jgi:simple sugar transport system permease protein